MLGPIKKRQVSCFLSSLFFIVRGSGFSLHTSTLHALSSLQAYPGLRFKFISSFQMPSKRKAGSSIAVRPPPTKRASTRARRPAIHPYGEPANPLANHPSANPLTNPPHEHHDPAVIEFITTSLEAHRDEVAVQMMDFDASLQANTHQLNDIVSTLNEIRQQLHVPDPQPNSGSSIPVTGIHPPPLQPQHDILAQWTWVDHTLVESIANGEFDIYNLPKLHRQEHLRNRYVAKSVEGIIHPLSGGRPHIVQAKTRLQSSFKDLGTFLSAWMIYVSIRSSYSPERGPGLSIWTERVVSFASLDYEFTSIVDYVVAYFQKYQNASPDLWFNIDTELHTEHFGNAAQRAIVNALRVSGSIKSTPTKPFQKGSIPITEQICHNWNRVTGCKIKETTHKDCLRRHVCSRCEKSAHRFFECTAPVSTAAT